MNRFLAVLWVALIALAVPAAAQTLPARPATPVFDQAKLLRPEQVIDIESKATALYGRTGRTFFVATVNSLQGLTVEDYGVRLIRHWQVGDTKRDDGVILIVAPVEKKVRIETGYGAEGFLPDILAGRIIRDTIVPKFKTGDMGAGVVAGADAIMHQMSLSAEDVSARTQEIERDRREDAQLNAGNLLPAIIIVIIFFAIVGGMSRRARGRRFHSRRRGGSIDPWIVLWGLNELGRASRGRGGWGGGDWGGGGGFGGFGGGGGSFGGFGGSGGGGGASGSW